MGVNPNTWGRYPKRSSVREVFSPPLKAGLMRCLLAISSLSTGIEWGSDRSGPLVEAKGESFKRLAGDPNAGVKRGQMAHSLRSLGTAALNYGQVAQGGLDIYWCVHLFLCAGHH